MKEKVKYEIYLKNEHYKTQCKKTKGKILCVPFLPFLLKNVGRREQNQLPLSSFN